MLEKEKEKRIKEIEDMMSQPDFWIDKEKAKNFVKELNDLKNNENGSSKYDKGDALMTIFSGAGGDDAEDFSSILLNMYIKYINNNDWGFSVLHKNENDHGGYRNITIEIKGKGVYGKLKNESGVHRLVRISPFNAKQLRHTSFSMVEVIPKFEKNSESDIVIPENDLRVEVSKSSGPGGQNVNKRETAVRVVHIPTNMSVHVESERSQAQNKEKALQMLRAKIYKRLEEERISKEKGMYISKTTSVEWGNQIRSYVMHPYKLVKDHRTEVESRDIDAVLSGNLDKFIDAEKDL